MIAHQHDVHTAMEVHLLQPVHQLTDDVIDLLERVIQLSQHTHSQCSLKRLFVMSLCVSRSVKYVITADLKNLHFTGILLKQIHTQSSLQFKLKFHFISFVHSVVLET